MILDSHGRELRRAIGFIGGFVPASKAQTLVDAVCLVGLEVNTEEAEEAEDAARNRDRTRRGY